MKKLTLNLDELRVESFETSPTLQNQRGTIDAYSETINGDTEDWRCFRLPGASQGMTCMATCQATCETCGFSCGGTCGQGTCYGDSCPGWSDPEYC
jgi:hypothetical protein